MVLIFQKVDTAIGPRVVAQAKWSIAQPCRHKLWSTWLDSNDPVQTWDTLPRPRLSDGKKCSLEKLRWSRNLGCKACKLVLELLAEWSADWKEEVGDGATKSVQIYTHFHEVCKSMIVTLRPWDGSVTHCLLWLLRQPKGRVCCLTQ
jgi:hypothetical protein